MNWGAAKAGTLARPYGIAWTMGRTGGVKPAM